MPIIYPKAIRRKFRSLNLEKVKESLTNKGYEFVRDGGFRPEDEPFKFCNYLFYKHPETEVAIRIGYDYPNHIFEICYVKTGGGWWSDVRPDFHRNVWKEVSDWYRKDDNSKFIKVNL